MRTTLILNDDLVVSAKRVAAERGQSLSAVVNEALQKALQTPSPEASKTVFKMPTFSPGGKNLVDTLPSEINELLAAEEHAPYNR